ncbi:hypothetical protein C8J56DRAFT_893361 [Mycena floridula]|nr:hypothetical protein C8J56DRAFT_893361 [Mycena floridula]
MVSVDQDILDYTYSFLDHADLKRVTLTSKGMRSMADRHLFHTLHLTGPRVHDINFSSFILRICELPVNILVLSGVPLDDIGITTLLKQLRSLHTLYSLNCSVPEGFTFPENHPLISSVFIATNDEAIARAFLAMCSYATVITLLPEICDFSENHWRPFIKPLKNIVSVQGGPVCVALHKPWSIDLLEPARVNGSLTRLSFYASHPNHQDLVDVHRSTLTFMSLEASSVFDLNLSQLTCLQEMVFCGPVSRLDDIAASLHTLQFPKVTVISLSVLFDPELDEDLDLAEEVQLEETLWHNLARNFSIVPSTTVCTVRLYWEWGNNCFDFVGDHVLNQVKEMLPNNVLVIGEIEESESEDEEEYNA